jgi:hypothetical protein
MIDRTTPPDPRVIALVDTLTAAADARLGEGGHAREAAFAILEDCGARAGEAGLARDMIEPVMEAFAGLGGAQISTRQLVCAIVPLLSGLPEWPAILADAGGADGRE